MYFSKKREKRVPYRELITVSFRCLALLFIFALAACGSSTGQQQGATPVSSSAPYAGNRPQKGPGSPALTETARATPVVVNCQLPIVTAPDTQDWQTYTNTQYHVRFSFPPKWKVGETAITSADGSASYYEIMALPPTGHLPVIEESNMIEPEYISLSMILSGPVDQFSSESTWIAEPAPIQVSHVSTKLSYSFSPDCGELDLATDPVTFGQYPYSFFMTSSDQADKTKDSQNFLGIVQSFSYTNP